MKRPATAIWQGSLLGENGVLASESYVLDPVPSEARTEDGGLVVTGPGEVMAAAHTQCLSMALSGAFADPGYKPEKLTVSAQVTLGNILVHGWTITSSHLVLVAKGSGINTSTFTATATDAKADCPCLVR